MHAKGGSPVAFVEYGDLKCASQAMAALQGSFLISSDRGSMRIEYAKTKMAEVKQSYKIDFKHYILFESVSNVVLKLIPLIIKNFNFL
jgi:hypothetical protein